MELLVLPEASHGHGHSPRGMMSINTETCVRCLEAHRVASNFARIVKDNFVEDFLEQHAGLSLRTSRGERIIILVSTIRCQILNLIAHSTDPLYLTFINAITHSTDGKSEIQMCDYLYQVIQLRS